MKKLILTISIYFLLTFYVSSDDVILTSSEISKMLDCDSASLEEQVSQCDNMLKASVERRRVLNEKSEKTKDDIAEIKELRHVFLYGCYVRVRILSAKMKAEKEKNACIDKEK